LIENIEEKLNNLKIEKKAFINGEYVESIGKNTITKQSSIDARDISGLSACNEKDINIAVSFALESYKSRVWVDKELVEKQKVLLKLADLIEENIEELALLDTLETGRSIKNYYYDSIPKAIETIRWFANAVDKVYEQAIAPRKNSFATITREPLGVVGIITPWNDPLVVAFWKITPALLMGNSIVVKPAEQSSFSILRIAKLAIEAGIPKGVFNVVPGYGYEAGKALALHNDVRGIFFTGSTFVGKKILKYSGQSNMKKVGLECGGKSPFIVSNKCNDIKKASEALAKNIFYNQGQICSASSRLIIHQDVKEDFLKLLIEESKKYLPQNPLNLESEVGAVVSQNQKDRIEGYISSGIESGAKIITDINSDIPNQNGAYINPVIFDNVDINSTIAQEEIFGPVLVVLSVETIKEAIKIANDSKYGLAAAIWTNDYDEAYQVSRLLESGIVHINSYGEDDNMVPFGGVKESGLGVDKSIYAFDEYSNQKTIWMSFKSL
jgi:acyl-CoA reductase-like NAD-dependent aldehyde dehydrogenase